MPGIYFGNMENDSIVKWFYDQLVYHKIIKIDPSSSYKSFITPLYENLLAQAMQAEKERLELFYQDGKEAVIIESIATLSTIKESSYSKGYNEGYLKALESMTKR